MQTGTTKPFLTLEKQVSLLQERGLAIVDVEYAKAVLATVNYYRFSAYSLTFRKNDKFYDDAKFEDICAVYNFDTAVRALVMKYTSYIETSLRAQMAYVHAKRHGPLGYLSNMNYENPWHHAQFLAKLDQLLKHSKEPFVLHHKNDLGGQYPIWVAVEVMSFDVASKCFQNMLSEDKAEIAAYYNVHKMYIDNWVHCSVVARNIAAHGGRFYNRPLAVKALIPKKLDGRFSSSRAFAYFYAIYKLLPSTGDKLLFKHELSELLANNPIAKPIHLGIPDDWAEILDAPIDL